MYTHKIKLHHSNIYDCMEFYGLKEWRVVKSEVKPDIVFIFFTSNHEIQYYSKAISSKIALTKMLNGG